jgi:hypothetical protein
MKPEVTILTKDSITVDDVASPMRGFPFWKMLENWAFHCLTFSKKHWSS